MSSFRDSTNPGPGDLTAADDWYYCPVCDDDDLSPKERVEARFSTHRGVTRHLLQGHDKTDLVAELTEEVEQR